MTEAAKLTLQPALDILTGDIDRLDKLEYTVLILGQALQRKGFSSHGIMDAVRVGTRNLNDHLFLRQPNGKADD